MGQKSREKRERQKRSRRLKNEKKQAAIRAKYGPKRKPAKVIVKSVETGEVIEIVDQSAFRRGFADSLEEKARAAGFAGYGGYLRSKHWRGLRAQVLERDGHRCRRCRTDRNLSVHHRYYDVLGAERLSSLETLCEDCHRAVHS